MKNHSKIYRRFLVAISFTLLYFSIGAQAIASIDPGTLDNELNTPAVTSKQAGVLTSVMARYEQELIDQGLAVEMLRDDQVLDITIDLDYIFGPNSISILPTASEFLNPIIDFTRQFGKFKILMAVHSDNTGSEKYKEWLCEQRVIALYDFFDTFGSSPAMVYGYPMADREPIVDNNSKTNRALNRRLEIFIVPGPELINNLKSKR